MVGNRRGFILGFAALLAAPSIVRASNLMPSSVIGLPNQPDFWLKPHLSENWNVPKWQAGYWEAGGLPRYEEVDTWNVPRVVRANPKTFILQSDYHKTRLMQNDARSCAELQTLEDSKHVRHVEDIKAKMSVIKNHRFSNPRAVEVTLAARNV